MLLKPQTTQWQLSSWSQYWVTCKMQEKLERVVPISYPKRSCHLERKDRQNSIYISQMSRLLDAFPQVKGCRFLLMYLRIRGSVWDSIRWSTPRSPYESFPHTGRSCNVAHLLRVSNFDFDIFKLRHGIDRSDNSIRAVVNNGHN